MQLSPETWNKVKRLFDEALELSPEQRSEFLASACPDLEIRSHVRKLLESEDQRGTFLDTRRSERRPVKSETCSPGHVLAGRFKVVRFLAKGGMGEVYQTEDLELHDTVALKLMKRELLADPDALRRFKREVRLSRQITHPNVYRIFDIFRHYAVAEQLDDHCAFNTVFVSMELLRGETLANKIERDGRMSTVDALPIALQMTAALQAAHEKQILHRDFKPGNVFLAPGGGTNPTRVVVTDFGLALGLCTELNSSLTPISLDQFFGTPAYMSPEQLAGRQLTAASDVYSLGLVLYQIVTGTIPFEDETPFSTAAGRLRDALASPRTYVPELSRVWESVILKCLERDPDRRFHCAAEVASALTENTPMGVSRRSSRNFISIAILPFVNASRSPETEYLSDGITEEIINILSGIPDVHVIARSTVFRYKSSDSDPQAIGRQLNVTSVLTGRVVQRERGLTARQN